MIGLSWRQAITLCVNIFLHLWCPGNWSQRHCHRNVHMSLSVDLINQLSTCSCVGWLDCIKMITSTTPGWYRWPAQSSGSEVILWQSSENTELFVSLPLCHLPVIPKALFLSPGTPLLRYFTQIRACIIMFSAVRVYQQVLYLPKRHTFKCYENIRGTHTYKLAINLQTDQPMSNWRHGGDPAHSLPSPCLLPIPAEPLYRGHHWDPAGCPVYSGTSL